MTSATHPPIKLFQFPRMFGIPNVSPFCCKLETWLRIAGIPYEVVDTPDPRTGPQGQTAVHRRCWRAHRRYLADRGLPSEDPRRRSRRSSRRLAARDRASGAAHRGRTLRVHSRVHTLPSKRGLATHARQVRVGTRDHTPADRPLRARACEGHATADLGMTVSDMTPSFASSVQPFTQQTYYTGLDLGTIPSTALAP
jgi:hypothetical protein